MNLVEQIARQIDAEGAYGIGYPSTSPHALPIPFTTRQKYFQASYECKAIDLLKMLLDAGFATDAVREELVQWEKFGWQRLGVNIELTPEIAAETDAIIRNKYAPPPDP